MAVTEADIRKIAELARLSIADGDLSAVATELNGILSHMDVLAEIDTSSVDSQTGSVAGGGAPLRKDTVDPIPMNMTAPMLASESEDGFILVPRLATHEEL